MKRIYLIACLLAVAHLPVYSADFFSDIPGDGVITCGPNASFQPVCLEGVGTVSIASGALSGALQQGGSTLGIDLAATAFLTFTASPPNPNNPPGYNPQWLGPLGLNPKFQPSATNVGDVGLPPNLPPSLAYLDATVPLAGQAITLNVRNTSSTSLTSVSFFLGRDINSLSSTTARQNDGLTFGVYCSGQVHAQGTPNDCALSQNWNLLITPSGPGILNSADIDSSSATFGDVLRFGSMDMAPGQTGEFTFFLTDYTSTRTPPGGVFTPANQSFVLAVEPNLEPIPEPGERLLTSIGFIALSGLWWIAKRNVTRSARHCEPASASGDLRARSHTPG